MHETFVWQKPTEKRYFNTNKNIREKVEQVVNSEDTDDIKIAQLKEIDTRYYKSLIRHLAYKKTLGELEDLVIVLKDLVYLTTELGKLSEEVKYYTDAAIFTNMSLLY